MIPKAYNAGDTEDALSSRWEESGAFIADAKSKKEPFSISMPPPNATGQLHLGHAVMLAIQDIFTRFARMQGKEALWLPGTDHASIATEALVIRRLQKEGMPNPRATLGREELLRRIAAFVEDSRDTIRSQIRKMGCSCDWSRERYTLDPTIHRCVHEVFSRMYHDGLIYRGHYIVNWDPKLQTTVSDDEVDYKEETAPFYTFKYGPFLIGTSRPETKFGDKYVVMHPDDERYLRYKHGETFDAEWINGTVKATIIKDEAVDPSFGTGVMTITPWHDMVDFDIAKRHGLEREQIIDYNGTLLPIAGDFAGMSIDEARPLIVNRLREKGLLMKMDETYVHNKAINSRGGGAIEPQIKLQWFIDVNKPVVAWKGQCMSLKQIMHDVVHTGDIRIIPDRFNTTYFHWIDHLRDWCISRQIWWGHRVPVWYKDTEGAAPLLHIGSHAPEDGEGWYQDPDTLDTWFSAALWTWSTLIDPSCADDPTLSLTEMMKRSPDFQFFHPTTILETGYDILPFWVARMILMTTYATGQVPFRTVYLHGLIRARDGRKMSKSHPETMIDPLEMIRKYGADALRLSMIVGQSPGNDARLYEEKIAGYRNFINKLWNASRFVLLQCEKAGIDPHTAILSNNLSRTLADRALLSSLQTLIADSTDGMHTYRLSDVGERLYSFVWDYFCDWYLEISKGAASPHVLVHSLRILLTLLHPYCPFVTEEIWTYLRGASQEELLMKESWPVVDISLQDAQSEADLQRLIDSITAIRQLRTEQGIQPGKEVKIHIVSPSSSALFLSQQEVIERMGKCRITLLPSVEVSSALASSFLAHTEIHLVIDTFVDVAHQRDILVREKEELSSSIQSLSAKLNNENFVQRAPVHVVDSVRTSLKEGHEKLAKIDERIAILAKKI